MDPNEREQYRAAIYGNREAFEMIIRTHSRALFAIAYGILQNREEAEDVTQDALLKAWKTRWRVREPEKFPVWLATIHDEIDNWLAADIHGELSEDERSALHAHIVDCAACRKAHQENKVMNKMLEETLAQEKPDPAFEQRMLAGFRDRIPQRSGLVKLLVDLMRLRAVQITAVAAVLLALVQVGRMITGEGAAVPRNREYAGGKEYAAQPGRRPQALTDELSAVRKSENGRR